MQLSDKEFRELAKAAFKELPDEFKDKLDNLSIVIEDYPPDETRRSFGSGGLLGLYHGVPLRRRGIFYSNVLPDRIILYKKNIEAVCRNIDELKDKIADVLFHEIGHHFGLSEAELKKISESRNE